MPVAVVLLDPVSTAFRVVSTVAYDRERIGGRRKGVDVAKMREDGRRDAIVDDQGSTLERGEEDVNRFWMPLFESDFEGGLASRGIVDSAPPVMSAS